MRKEDLKEGRTYYLPVAYTKSPKSVTGGGNMVRCVTEDEGTVVWVHPEALLTEPKEGGQKNA